MADYAFPIVLIAILIFVIFFNRIFPPKKESACVCQTNDPRAGAIRRYAARWIDLMLVVCLILAMMIPMDPSTAPQETRSGFPYYKDFFFAFFVALFTVLIDSFAYAVFGNTFGKFLFGIKVLDSTGEPLKPFDYFARNLKIFFFGLGCGILAPFTMFAQFTALIARKSTSYDKTPPRFVVKRNATTIKTALGIIIFLMVHFLLVVLIGILNVKNSLQ